VKATLSMLWFYWRRFGHRLGMAQTQIVLTLSYLLVFAPGRLALLIKGSDPLAKSLKGNAESYYQAKEESGTTLEEYKRQF
jgi:hypothetical protein